MENKVIKCKKCGQAVVEVHPTAENGWLSHQHLNRKWDASHDVELITVNIINTDGKSEKATRIMRVLDTIQNNNPTNDTLIQIIGTIVDKVEFYDNALKGWNDPHQKCNTPECVDIGRKCCNAGLDMADAIVNELRIVFCEGNQFSK